MASTCGTPTFSRGPADSLTRSPSNKAEEAIAVANIKATALDADVVEGAVVAVTAIRAAAVTKDVAYSDTTDRAVGAKVCTTKETKAPPTSYAGSCNQGAGGWSNTGWSNNVSYPTSLQPKSQNAQSFHDKTTRQTENTVNWR